MAIGRTFLEALQKACQSQENNRSGLGADIKEWIQTDDILNRLEKVKKVTPEPLEDGWVRYTVWVDSGTDSRERIAQLTSQYGWPLRSLFRHVATLEDVFVELTRRD